ncbi:MAG: carbohydrate kinase family protein [Bradymonadaceae bacterium]
MATERFASRFTGVGELDRLCRALLEAGPKAVAIKLGKEGVVGLSEGEGGLVRRDGPTVDVCDSTGEGDVFLGAFSYVVATDRGFADALQLANVASSLSNRGLGARGALPTLDEVQKWTE